MAKHCPHSFGKDSHRCCFCGLTEEKIWVHGGGPHGTMGVWHGTYYKEPRRAPAFDAECPSPIAVVVPVVSYGTPGTPNG